MIIRFGRFPFQRQPFFGAMIIAFGFAAQGSGGVAVSAPPSRTMTGAGL